MSSLFSKIGNVLGKVAGVATGFATGGIGGGVAALLPAPARPPIPANTPLAGFSGGLNLGPYNFGGSVTYGKQTTYSASGSATMPGGQGCPRGYHLNKHALPASRSHGAVPARSVCVRNRHVNALNGRAAQRALRRLKRADKMTRKIHHLFHRPARHPAGRKR